MSLQGATPWALAGHGNHGEVSDNLKVSDDIVIFKKEDTETVLQVHTDPGKVMDKILSEALSKYTKNKRVMGICQCGFTKGKCQTHCFLWRSDWCCESGQDSALDFIKAFGTVSHTLLISKLVEDKWIIKWVEYLLGSCAQRLVISHAKSNFIPVALIRLVTSKTSN